MEDILDLDHFDDDISDTKDGRKRTWMVLLYEDSSDVEAVKNRLDELDWNYCGIRHDKDAGIKIHHHIILVFKDARKVDDVANDLGIDKRWLRPHDKKKRAMRYLCHKDNRDKFQYDPNEIYGSIAEDAMKQCVKSADDERDNVTQIVKLLDSIDGRVSYSSFITICCDRGLWSALRRMGPLSVKLVDEHNNVFAYRDQRVRDLQGFADYVSRPVDDFAGRCEGLDKLGFPSQPLD